MTEDLEDLVDRFTSEQLTMNSGVDYGPILLNTIYSSPEPPLLSYSNDLLQTNKNNTLTPFENFTINLTSPTPSNREEIMKPWVYLTWIFVFSAMIFVAICGNLIVMWIVVGKFQNIYSLLLP